MDQGRHKLGRPAPWCRPLVMRKSPPHGRGGYHFDPLPGRLGSRRKSIFFAYFEGGHVLKFGSGQNTLAVLGYVYAATKWSRDLKVA